MTEEEICLIYRAFSSEMKKWNDKFYPLMEENIAAVRGQAIDELRPVFDCYVWDDATRREDMLHAPSVCFPSDYDPETETIEKVDLTRSKAILNVQTHVGFKDMFRYIFTRKGDDWRLSKRQIFDEISDGWKSHHI
jgi:hypothetical protein